MFISEKVQDLAGKWRVRISEDDGNSFFLKFKNEPSNEEALAQATLFIEQREIDVVTEQD
jgi:hypothetical protein